MAVQLRTGHLQSQLDGRCLIALSRHHTHMASCELEDVRHKWVATVNEDGMLEQVATIDDTSICTRNVHAGYHQ